MRLRSTTAQSLGARHLLVLVAEETDGSCQLVGHRMGLAVRARARWRASELDRRLAAGCSPDTDPLRAARARRLVSLRARRHLAFDWQRVVEQARHPRRSLPGAPLCRDRVLAAESDVRQLLEVLARPNILAVRGVAMANQLLTDGAGPLYHGGSEKDVGAEVRATLEHLDPSTSVESPPSPPPGRDPH